MIAVASVLAANAPVGPIDLTGPLVAVMAVALTACVALVVAVLLLSRPRRARIAPVRRGAHSADATGKAEWRARIDDVVERHASGALNREDAFAELAAVARDFASVSSGRDLGSHTLADLRREDKGASGRGGIDLLRMTVAALYPPEFADAAVNAHARDVSVEEAAGWVRNLVERWGRR
ncbi:peptidyl-prolyl cis-trans isomerase [Bifidobacterium saguinibicoloris]|uniref:peptidyl-prolyl cis-trans isomerase n=1 Tax=Bifidobacterium saguinibicoloris TaxID=2834433 RepID=UPI001C5680E4|nr:peptidyl-prolyl cis-trans isomerase [Bifidobacterium saguinibicoloris]MBW3080627.1 hypothetical protein [Bifidobacterium saguinibicoloris]